MRLLGREELSSLMQCADDVCVSIYLPTQRTGDVEQSVIGLKNLLREAEDRLRALGIRQPEAAGLLGRPKALLDDPLFWHGQSDVLALFVSSGTFKYFRLPYRLEENVVVGDRFYLSPLLPLFSADGIFYVLGLSQNRVRLLQCSRDGARELAPEVLPEGLADVLQYDVFSKNLQFRSGPSQGASGAGNAMYHGHGEGKDTEKDNLVRFIREVDHGLNEALKDEQAPLILAGVEYMRSLFREVTSYPFVLEGGVQGNPDQSSPSELQSRAWPLVQEHFTRERLEALDLFNQAHAHGLTASLIEDVVMSAEDGRVSALFVGLGVHRWGRFDSANRVVEVHDSYQPGDEDLVDAAVEKSLMTGAAVYVVPAEQVPNGECVAALLRY